MKAGDIVTRKSYNHDIIFMVENISGDQVQLSGLNYRLSADATVSDLQVSDNTLSNDVSVSTESDTADPAFENTRGIMTDFLAMHKKPKDSSGDNTPSEYEVAHEEDCYVKILHIDADEKYLNVCLGLYKNFGLHVIGASISEEMQPMSILGLLVKYNPNILVITGHDSMSKEASSRKDIDSYLHSKYFAESIKIARHYNNNYDDLVIIAGGCKSYYEALIEAGANFASSPGRMLITVTEPVNIACKLATTSIHEILSIDNIVPVIPSGLSGFGGIETRGQCRMIKPKP